MFIQQLVGVVGIIAATFLVQTWVGRRGTYSIGQIGCALCSIVFVASKSYALTLTFTSIQQSFLMIDSTAITTFAPESYPTRIRSLGNGWSQAHLKLGAIAAPLVIGLVLESAHGIILAL
jgi:putative MFS transporter